MDCSPSGFCVMGFPRQGYWSGLSFPSPGDLPNSGIKARSSALADRFFTTESPGELLITVQTWNSWSIDNVKRKLPVHTRKNLLFQKHYRSETRVLKVLDAACPSILSYFRSYISLTCFIFLLLLYFGFIVTSDTDSERKWSILWLL